MQTTMSNPRSGAQGALDAPASRDDAPSRARATADLLDAFQLLTRRGAGMLAWAAPFRDHPIAFLLDSMGDAANLWGAQGELLYQNRAAAALGLGRADDLPSEGFATDGRLFERRCLRFRADEVEYVLEVIHEVRPAG